jgi:hypothetical protein
MERSDVYKLIDGERDYQDSLGPDRREPRETSHSVGAYVTMLSAYTHKAVLAWTENPGDRSALDVVRKIAGIAVRCMEEHGAPPRAVALIAESDNNYGVVSSNHRIGLKLHCPLCSEDVDSSHPHPVQHEEVEYR